MHICVSELDTIGSKSGSMSVLCGTITYSMLPYGQLDILEKNSSENSIEIYTVSFEQMH